MIIAMDGPAAAGKGTLSRRLAQHFGFDHLDTGALYRATACKLIERRGDPSDPDAAVEAAAAVSMSDLRDPAIRSENAGRLASIVSAHRKVRAILLDHQQSFANNPPGGQGAIVEGRDIGTVVCPNADLKIYVDASLEVRVARRCEELKQRGGSCSSEEIRAEMVKRDDRDRTRIDSPLSIASDAHLLDTTELDIEEAFSVACSLVDKVTTRL